MPATLRTKPSTPRLSELARHLVIPEGIVTTGWPRVEAKGRELGLLFDWWQIALGRVVLGKREDGKYAATVGGVVLSIPRQVGKTYFVGALLLIMCILFPGLQVVWTAHHNRTTTRTFQSLQGMARRKKVWPHVLSVRTANGEQEIRFRNGSVIMFGAREQGFGRGFDAIDVEVFDEAQKLTDKALEDMVAATNQARHPHGALLFYMGTPPRPVDPGEVFTFKRRKALDNAVKSKGAPVGDELYLECGADPGCNPDDPKQWAKANFSYPQRTPHEAMLRLRENLNSLEGWLREGLGVWDDDSLTTIPMSAWDGCADRAGQIDGQVVLSVDVSFDRINTYIGVCGPRTDGKRQVEVVELTVGDVPAGTDRTTWLLDKIEAAAREWDAPVVIAKNGNAAPMIPKLEARSLEVDVIEGFALAQACGELFDSVVAGTVAHLGDKGLRDAVKGAQKRGGESFVFTRKGDVDISPLYAVLLALWGWTTRHAVGDVLQAVW